MKNFKALNIHCENCANTIKNALGDEFGKIEVDVKSGVVSLDISEERVAEFKSEMDDLGFEIVGEI